MTLTEIGRRPRPDAAIAQIVRAAKESLGEESARRLQKTVRASGASSGASAEPAGRRVNLKGTDGSDLIEVLRVVVAAISAGFSIDVSLGRPLADRLHRGLVRADVGVRVETTERWVDRVAIADDEVILVGPEQSRRATLRRARSRIGLSRPIVDVADTDLLDADAMHHLLHDAPSLRAVG